MVQHSAYGLAVGKDLFTRDGDHLGKVKEIQGGRFKVDAPMQPDYWLPASAIGEPLGNDLYVTFAKVQLDEFKVEAPFESDRDAMPVGSTETNAGYKSTTVQYTTGFTAALADMEWSEAEPHYLQEWERQNATAGGRWEEAAPGYRYAHGMSRDPRFQGRQWEEVETDFATGYVDWSIREGYAEQERDWARSRPYTREAWLITWRPR